MGEIIKYGLCRKKVAYSGHKRWVPNHIEMTRFSWFGFRRNQSESKLYSPIKINDMAFKRIYQYTEEEQKVYLYAFAISYPVRQRILKKLKQTGLCTVQELFKNHRIAKSTFSDHLKILKESGLVVCHEEYPFTYYCLDLKMLEDAIRYLGDFMKDDLGIGQ